MFVISSRRFKRDGGKRIGKGKRGSTGAEYSTIGETLGDLRSCQCFDHTQVCGCMMERKGTTRHFLGC